MTIWKSRNFPNVGLVIPLIIGLCLILLFFAGPDAQESLDASRIASGLAGLIRNIFDPNSAGQPPTALADLRSETGLRALLPAIPLAVIYSLFGINDFSMLLLPALATLLSCALLFFLAKAAYGQGAASLAALTWISLPFTLFAAVATLYGPIIVSLFFAGMFLWLRPQPRDKQIIRFGLTVLVALFLALFDPLVTVCFLAWAAASSPRLYEGPAAKGLVLYLGLGLVALFGAGGEAFLAFYDGLTRLAEMEVLLPLAFFCLAVSIFKFRPEHKPIFAVFVVCFLGLMWRASSAPSMELAHDPLLLLMFVAVSLLWGSILGTRLDPSRIVVVQLFCGLFILGFSWAITHGQLMLVPPYNRFDWNLGIQVLSILPGLVILSLLLFAPSLLDEEKSRLAANLATALMVITPMAIIPFLGMRLEQSRQPVLAAAGALEWLAQNSMSLPIYVLDDHKIIQQFDYWGLPEGASPVRHIEGVAQIGTNQSGLIVYWENDVPLPPLNWWQAQKFGALGRPRLVVARVLAQLEANRLLEQASLAVQRGASTAADYYELYGAAINAGQTCEAIRAWIYMQSISTDYGDHLPLQGLSLQECLDVAGAENLLVGLAPPLYPGFTRMEYASDAESMQEGAAFGFQYPFFQDPRTFSLETRLRAGRIYAYHVELQGPEELMPLYWAIGNDENYLDYGQYHNWAAFTVLFSTFGWQEDPLPAAFYPFLYYPEHLGGFTEFRNLGLYEVDIEMVSGN